MLDLFENGNYRRRRRRRNVKREPRDKRSSGEQEYLPALPAVESGFPHLLCPGGKAESQPKAAAPREFFPNTSSGRASLNSSSAGKSESEIKFSIDYILSAPDPLPVLRSPLYHMQDSKGHPLDSQQINLQFWTM